MRCCRAPFPAVGSVLVDSVEQPGAQATDLTQAPRSAPLLFCPPVAGHVEEPVAHEGVPRCCWARLQRCAAAGVGERAAQGVQEEAISSCVSGRAMASPGCHQSGRCGHHAEAHGGRGCAPEEHFPTAAACWSVRATAAACLVANSSQQTGRWRPARSAPHRVRMSPDQPTRMSAC